MRRMAIVLLLLGFSVPLIAQAEADAILAPERGVPGGKVLEWKTPQGRPYWYIVPKKIKQSEPPALILMLHGTGSSHGWSFWNYAIADGRFRRHDIIVSPDGMTPGGGDTFNFLQNKEDGEQIAGLIERFREEFPIGRVYLYGHSQGAFFTYWFAGEYPELVDGIVAHAGNVLQVKHSKLSREKVAIAILHGKADAVVTVECAYRTHEIYRKEGYRKLKLYVVEGLNERTGHWPLPQQVLELFDWLDEVSDKTAGQAVNMALAQFTRENPNLDVMRSATLEARDLLKKVKGEERKSLEARVVKLEEFLVVARQAHLEALSDVVDGFDPKAGFQSWMPHFVAADRVFGEDPEWRKALKKPRSLAAKHRKSVSKALDRLGKKVDKKSFSAAIKALDLGYLSPRYQELSVQLERIADSPPKGAAAGDHKRLQDILAARKEPLESGYQAFLMVTKEAMASFVENHPDLLPEEKG